MTIELGTAADFFAGVGLARMGLEDAGWRVSFSNDISQKKYNMFRGHWGEDPNYIVRDVFDLRPDDVPATELAWASFPCIDLSLAGNRSGLDGKHSGAFWGFYRVLVEKHPDERPFVVILENVTGMLTSHAGKDLEVAVSHLNELGYTVDLLSVDAAHFVPQSRPRLFVVGVRSPYSLPYAAGQPVPGARSLAVATFIRTHSHLRWGSVETPIPSTRRQGFSEIVEWFPPEADIWWSEEATNKLLGQMSDRHLQAVNLKRTSEDLSFATIYRRMRKAGYMAEARFDDLAGCLRTPSGGSSKQFILQMGKGLVSARNMTAIEYARLQGAPHYKIEVTYNEALFGFGDGVCVPVVSWVTGTYLS